MEAIGGSEEMSVSTPRNRVKFLCSYGGKILPRPADGKLKYVGGETRLVVVPRDINFSELMNKLSSLFGGDTVLKYQLIPEDLDALVSVTNDDDLRYMLDEYDRHSNSNSNSSENSGIPRLRAFLFPSDPILIENQTAPNNKMDNYALDQRYIDAINGVVRTSTNTGRTVFSIASSCGSSPRSTGPDIYSPDSINHDMFMPSGFRREMHRVHSSPSELCNIGHHHHQRTLEQQQQQPYVSSRFQGPYNGGGTGLLAPAFSVGRSEIARPQMGHIRTRYYSPSRAQNGGGHIGCGHDGGLYSFQE